MAQVDYNHIIYNNIFHIIDQNNLIKTFENSFLLRIENVYLV